MSWPEVFFLMALTVVVTANATAFFISRSLKKRMGESDD